MSHVGQFYRVRVVPPAKGKPRWRLRITQIGGDPVGDRVVDARDRAHAEQLAAARLDALEREAGAHRAPSGELNVSGLVAAYLEAQERLGEWSPNTSCSAATMLRRVTERIGGDPVSALLDRSTHAALYESLRASYAASTTSSTRSWLRACWSWAYDHGIVAESMPSVRQPRRAAASGKRAFSSAESRDVLAYTREHYPEEWIACALCASTGARPHEVLAIRPQDVSATEGVIYLRKTKGDRPRHVGVPAEVLELLDLGRRGPLFRTSTRGLKLRPDTLRSTIKRHVLPHAAADPDLSLYSWRKAWASIAPSLGIHPLVAKAQLGHAGADQHERVYVAVSHTDLTSAAEAVWAQIRPDSPKNEARPSGAQPHSATLQGEQSALRGQILNNRSRARTQAAPMLNERIPLGPGDLRVLGGEGQPHFQGAETGSSAQGRRGRDVLELLHEPHIARLARWADEDPETMLRLLRDEALRERLEAAILDALGGEHQELHA